MLTLLLSQKKPYDVIRGEETQVLGYLHRNKKFSGFICLPGTHSKWIKIKKGKLINFKTYMTGELFEVISKNSILKHSINDKKINKNTFENSVILSQKKNFNLFDYLFEFRSRTLLSKKTRLQSALLMLDLQDSLVVKELIVLLQT